MDDLFQKIEDARLQLRHSDARRLFGDEDDTGEKRDGLRSLSWNANLEPELGMKGNECQGMNAQKTHSMASCNRSSFASGQPKYTH